MVSLYEVGNEALGLVKQLHCLSEAGVGPSLFDGYHSLTNCRLGGGIKVNPIAAGDSIISDLHICPLWLVFR
jgi:hypothetical protein